MSKPAIDVEVKEILEDIILTAVSHRCGKQPMVNVQITMNGKTRVVILVEDEFVGLIRGSKLRTEVALLGLVILLTGDVSASLSVHPLSQTQAVRPNVAEVREIR